MIILNKMARHATLLNNKPAFGVLKVAKMMNSIENNDAIILGIVISSDDADAFLANIMMLNVN